MRQDRKRVELMEAEIKVLQAAVVKLQDALATIARAQPVVCPAPEPLSASVAKVEHPPIQSYPGYTTKKSSR